MCAKNAKGSGVGRVSIVSIRARTSLKAHPISYSSYESEGEADPSIVTEVRILGSGPNASVRNESLITDEPWPGTTLREFGVESIMVKATGDRVHDYDTETASTLNRFTLERSAEIEETEKPQGVIVQFGGQTPLEYGVAVKRAGVPCIGNDFEYPIAEDRKLLAMLDELGIRRRPIVRY